MWIKIEYDSCWQTSFLGDDTKKPISTKLKKKQNTHASSGYMQKFIATSGTKGDKPSTITKSTVLGVLCRLIGEQRKLYQIQESKNYYFADIEDKISFEIGRNSEAVSELMYLTNKSDDRCAQSNFLGVLSNDNAWFFSKESPLLWSVLFLDKEQLLDFVLQDNSCPLIISNSLPKTIRARVGEITDTKQKHGEVLRSKEDLLKMKQMEIDKHKKTYLTYKEKIEKSPAKTEKLRRKNQDKLKQLEIALQVSNDEYQNISLDKEMELFDQKLKNATGILSSKYSDPKNLGEEYLKAGIAYPYRIYSAALYLQAERLISEGGNIDFVKNDKGMIQIKGFSKRGFNGVRDWLNSMAGGRKKAVGSPCTIQKQSGHLEINLDISRDRAEIIKGMIESAGVSSFYLGKKGLAYISQEIVTREVR
jgi:hypothetical protein